MEKIFGGHKRIPPPTAEQIAENRKHINDLVDKAKTPDGKPMFEGPNPLVPPKGDVGHISRHYH